MPQELQVVKCYSCEAFQVHIVKKSTKWECKICGEKQSIKKIYGRGSGKDCRLYVQELNQKRLENNREIFLDNLEFEYFNPEKNVSASGEHNNDAKSNRWAEFISPTTTVSSDAQEDSSESSKYNFERPAKKCRSTQPYKKCSNSTRKSLSSETTDQNHAAHNSDLNNQRLVSASFNDENEKKIVNYMLPKPSKINTDPLINQKLKEFDQKSHFMEKSNAYPLSVVENNAPFVSVQSSRWAEFVSSTDNSLNEAISYELPNNTFERSLKSHKFYEYFTSNDELYRNAHQTLKSETYSSTQIQKYEPNVPSCSFSFNEQKELKEDQSNKILINSSIYQQSNMTDSNFKLEEVTDLFDDQENNLDSLFSF